MKGCHILRGIIKGVEHLWKTRTASISSPFDWAKSYSSFHNIIDAFGINQSKSIKHFLLNNPFVFCTMLRLALAFGLFSVSLGFPIGNVVRSVQQQQHFQNSLKSNDVKLFTSWTSMDPEDDGRYLFSMAQNCVDEECPIDQARDVLQQMLDVLSECDSGSASVICDDQMEAVELVAKLRVQASADMSTYALDTER